MTRRCHIHTEREIPAEQWCPDCLLAWEERRDPGTMTPEERVVEMKQIDGPLQIPFNKVHQRIEELVGRPVFTHEMPSSNWEYLVQEAGNRVHPSPQSVLNLIPEEKRILVTREDLEAPR